MRPQHAAGIRPVGGADIPITERRIKSFLELRRCSLHVGPKRVAVVAADDDLALGAANKAFTLGMANPVLIGDISKIRAAAESLRFTELITKAEFVESKDPAGTAVRMAADSHVSVLLKGHLRSDQLLRAVLDRGVGLRTEGLLSDVLLYEDHLNTEARLVGISDGGVNVSPNLWQKREIVYNAIRVMDVLRLHPAKIAIMSATEVVSEAVPSTIDAKALSEMAMRGDFGEAHVFGPLALDCALSSSAAQAKNIASPVAGHVDCMVVPNIESGNLLGKSVKYLGRSQCAHVIVGAKVPILIPSRVESVEDKVNSIALGVMLANR